TRAERVLAFEPQTEFLEQLRQNLRLNGLAEDPRTALFRCFVGASNKGHQRTLDSFIETIVQPCLVKIDVDGGERDILAGAGRLLAERETRWLIETHSPQLETDCQSILHEAGYTTVIVPNAWWRRVIPEQRPIGHNRW